MLENVILSIAIVNYKTKDYLRVCLQSIFREHSKAYQIIVVDNASDDGSVEMVEKEFPSVHLIKNGKNIGFAKANNMAIECATGKYILFLNPDTELSGSTLNKLTAFMDRTPDVSAAGCKTLYPDGRIQPSCGHLPNIVSAIWGGGIINSFYRKFFISSSFCGASGIPSEALDTSQEVETLLGACVILKKEVFEKIGNFDEHMFMYFEESDFFYRLKRAGGKIVYTPEATVIHYAGGSSAKVMDKAVRYYQTSQEYYLKKNFSLKNILLFRISLLVSSILKTVFLISISFLNKRRRNQILKNKISWHWNMFLHLLRALLFPQSLIGTKRS